MLEFKLVVSGEEAKKVLDTVDLNISNNLSYFPALRNWIRKTRAFCRQSRQCESRNGVFSSLVRPGEVDFEVQYSDVRLLQDLLADSLFQQAVPMAISLPGQS
jgi:preprotein translocase subunit SecD